MIVLKKIFPFLRWSGFIGWDTLRADLFAGLTGAVIVLPQGVAFAMIAGLPPEYGLYTAIVVPIVAALFGSSLHLISGPTTAISIIVFTSLSPLAEPGSLEFVRLALTLTFIAGVFQFCFGLLRFGILVNFVSHSVLVGFTAGAAVLIATSQLKHIFGIDLAGSVSFYKTWTALFANIHQANLYAVMIAGVTFVSAVLIKFLRPRWPGLLLSMIIGSILAWTMDSGNHNVQLMAGLPANLPPLSLPDFSPAVLKKLVPMGFAVAMIGLIEALSIARSIAGFSRQPIDGNQEFIGQGLSNMVGSFFSSYAGSGSFTRSGINYQAGAMTPLSAIFAAVFLAVILLLMAPLTEFLPVPAMGGVILLVAFSLINVHAVKSIFRTSRDETIVLCVSFLATLLLDLEVAIYSGILVSLILYLSRTSHPQIIELPHVPEGLEKHLKIIRVDGSLFFGAVSHIMEYFDRIDQNKSVKMHILVVAYGINFIDITGAQMLVNESQKRQGSGGGLYLCGLKKQAGIMLEKGGYLAQIGKANVFDTETQALEFIMNSKDKLL